MDSPSIEDHNVTSQSSRIIQEYENPRVSVLRWSKKIKEIYMKVNDIPKVFGRISLFVSEAMSAKNSILP